MKRFRNVLVYRIVMSSSLGRMLAGFEKTAAQFAKGISMLEWNYTCSTYESAGGLMAILCEALNVRVFSVAFAKRLAKVAFDIIAASLLNSAIHPDLTLEVKRKSALLYERGFQAWAEIIRHCPDIKLDLSKRVFRLNDNDKKSCIVLNRGDILEKLFDPGLIDFDIATLVHIAAGASIPKAQHARLRPSLLSAHLIPNAKERFALLDWEQLPSSNKIDMCHQCGRFQRVGTRGGAPGSSIMRFKLCAQCGFAS